MLATLSLSRRFKLPWTVQTLKSRSSISSGPDQTKVFRPVLALKLLLGDHADSEIDAAPHFAYSYIQLEMFADGVIKWLG